MNDADYQEGMDASVEDSNADKNPSELDNETLYLRLKDWFLLDDAHSAEWRKQAMDDFDFVAGDQWPEKVKKVLEDQDRYPLTHNYTAPFIQAVCGLEMATRHETVYLPREVEEGEIVANETISSTSRWMGDQCDASDEQSEAFRDMLVCGMGWTEARMDWELEKDGKYVEERLEPSEMRWDRDARKKNIADSRRVHRVREMMLSEAKEMFPDALDTDLDAVWANGLDTHGQPKTIEERRMKLENALPQDPKSIVRIVQTQWYERQCYYRVARMSPMTGKMEEERFSEQDYAKLEAEAKEAGVKLKAAKQFERVYMQAFLGDTLLGKAPCPDPERFTLQCITGVPHQSKGTWFGLVRQMRDPQINANKWLSQALHILNATAKGGVIAERGAFKNLAEAQRSYSNPQAITLVEKDTISGQRIMAKPGTGLAAPYVQLTQHAIEAIPRVTGINLELLGLRDAQQAGVLEAQRKQAGMTILAGFFDSMKKYRRVNGRTRLYFIQNYMTDGTIIRVSGPQGMKAMRFIRDQHLGDYDVVVDDAPTAPNQKEITWNMIMQLGQVDVFQPLLQDPETAVEVLDYCPLPSKVVALLKKGIQTPKPDQQEGRMIALEKAIEDIRNLKADTQKKEADAGKADAGATLDRTRALIALADAGVRQLKEQRDANTQAAVRRMGTPGMPNGIPAPIPDDGMAVFEQKPQMGRMPADMADIEDMFVSEQQQPAGAF